MKELLVAHPELFTLMLGLLFTGFNAMVGVLGWFLVNTLQKIDANQTRLFESYDKLQNQLSELQGAHEERSKICPALRYAR